MVIPTAACSTLVASSAVIELPIPPSLDGMAVHKSCVSSGQRYWPVESVRACGPAAPRFAFSNVTVVPLTGCALLKYEIDPANIRSPPKLVGVAVGVMGTVYVAVTVGEKLEVGVRVSVAVCVGV